MPKGTEFFNAASTDSASTKTADVRGRSGSTSSAKYRVSSRPTNLPLPSSTDAADTSSRSPELRLNAANMSTLLKRMSKNSSSTETSGEQRNARFTLATEAVSPPRGFGAAGTPKLPQKLRQHVSRLRNQFAFGSNSASSRTLNLRDRGLPPAGSPQKATRSSIVASSINSKRFSIAAVAMQHARRSNQLQQLLATKEVEKPTTYSVPVASKRPLEPEITASNPSTFHDLLRPLQSSLSCASLNAGWSSDEEDEAEQLFRQSERENSRMLRVCCSIDNLMLSIGDQAQEQKQPEAIIRGATRDLVKLIQFAMKQVISVIFDKTDDQTSNNGSPSHTVGVELDGKEAQYAMEFLLEVNERIGRLYEFARSVFVNEVDELRRRIKEADEELAAVSLKNEQLQTEMRDLRDFYEQNNATSADSFPTSSSDPRHQALDYRSDDPAILALSLPEIPGVGSEAGGNENSALTQQCHELSRLLELAKQEIRLSHHERDVQKARVAEVSSALYHDSELGMLRNQLQSEKKRVRVLERENLTLREEQVTKQQSLEALQAAGPTATADAANNGPSACRPCRPSIDSANTTAVEQQRSVAPLNDSPGEAPMLASELTIETISNQFILSNYETTLPSALQDGAQGPALNWFSRIVHPPPVANARKPRKKQLDAKPEQRSPMELSNFIAGLLMTDKQVAVAKEESKARKQGNVPTLIPPMRALAARSAEGSGSRKTASKTRRPQSAAATSSSGNGISCINSAEAEECNEEIVAGCLQLAWAFYQRFLVAVEAQNLLGNRGIGGDPMFGSSVCSSAGKSASVSLSLIVFHFFLERCSREQDAVQELEQFVRCLHSVRSACYSLELFCQFLEESCSRQELCFFLWLSQAMDDIRLGIPYDDPLPSYYEGANSHQPQFICVLKATFLARSIFRLLHFKVLCRPSTARKSKRRGKAKRGPTKGSSQSIPVSVVAPTSPSASPQRKPKTRLGELSAALLVPEIAAVDVPDTGQVEQKQIPEHVAAQTALREIIEKNQGESISLETFNNLLVKFAVVPSPDELAARLGPFYQPTGDERKIPTDVFLALLMETYKLQLQWERDQLRALFVHINHQEEMQQRTTETLTKTEAANGKGDQPKAGEEEKKRPKVKLKRGKGRHGATESSGGSKYLHGLSRNVLRELLLQSGIVQDSDVAQMDMDWVFAELLKGAGGVAAGITFDSLFDVLQKMRWLESTKLRVDALMEVTGVISTKRQQSRGVKSPTKSKRASPVVFPSPTAIAIREKWRVYARHSLALCNNDPNVFIRRHTQRLLHYVDQELGQSESDSAVNCIREFLAFAWRLAAKRSRNEASALRQTCLTEIYLVSQALRPCIDSMSGYHGQFAAVEDNSAGEDNPVIPQRRSSDAVVIMKDALHSFYDTSRMNLSQFIKDKRARTDCASGQLHELENVLTLYAAHIEHLFQRFSEARYNCSPQVPFLRWRAMMYELELVHPRNLPVVRLQALFNSVVKALEPASSTDGSLDQEVGVGKSQFSELFVRIAIERHRVALTRKREKAQLATTKKTQDDNRETMLEAAELAARPARIMAQFCRKILAPRAFASNNRLVERNFAAKLSCPLVGRALLEHRSFLRTVFFFYAKQDEVAEDERAARQEQALLRELRETGGSLNGNANHAKGPDRSAAEENAALLRADPGSDFQLEKTKRSSMSFGEFQSFLAAFDLLDGSKRNGNKVALSDAQHVFSSVMALDNDDTLQLEFDEFAAAIVALAVHLDPSPFSLWHQKLDKFATKLQKAWETQNAELP
ncbi:hypothetical protein GN244_ATG18295 [Phytophthora infestans]|uniref:EF-hand domain-containing protein n=1 Tax=Phytophthora infestans TaxID=4787 RepID=A0A833S948_PHYIN|nr:hypothetical protein GN244_ATG18295 [Phytophthora infestans]